MERLAPEIISNIISHLVPDEYFSPAKFYNETRPPLRCLAHLAALCHRWQPLVEDATFRELKLNSESVSYAIENNFLTPRRLSYIRRVDYSFPPPDEAHPPTVGPEVDTGFLLLLQLLAQVPLQEEPLIDLRVTVPWGRPDYLSKLQDHVQDNFEDLNPSLPEIPMVKHLWFHSGGNDVAPEITCSAFNVPKQTEQCGEREKWSLHGLPSSIHEFDLSYYVNPTLLMDAIPAAPTEEDILSRELCRFSQREGLKDFSFQGSTEPTIFWPSKSDTAEDPHWPSLKAFNLTPERVSPSGRSLVVRKPWRPADNAADWGRVYLVDDVVNEYFVAAARCVSRMPKAEYLSIELKDSWYQTLVFCTGYPDDPDEPILRLSGGGGASIFEETEKEWRKAVEIHNLKFSMEVDEELD
ncbi:hypothetical protein FGADI_9302 [Fusarium gaditjirri]|uniref:F-box domain-containing protein n=1 Tax=Fusarium gaditjirri TaxID=282569 RepID=A0A8H4T0N0_9HYPO|nr:hypothetical protein FGADI_9302 [Fusarium gaditjirri]